MVPQVPKVWKKHWVFISFGVACSKNIENKCFFVFLECLWESIGLRRSFHNLGGQQKKSINRSILQLFFRQLGLGWAQAGSATSKVKVLYRRNVIFFKTCCFACTGGYVFKCFATNGAATWTRSSTSWLFPRCQKYLKNIEFSCVLELHAQKTLKILVFSIAGVPMGVHWAPSQLPQFGRPKKK